MVDRFKDIDVYELLEEHEHTQKKSSVNIYDLLTKRSDFLRHRPRKWSGVVLKKIDFIEVTQVPKDGEQYILKNPRFDTIYKLDEKSLFLWEMMDGKHTVRDLLLAYYNRYGSFGYDRIVNLIMHLRKNLMLTEEYVNVYEKLSLWIRAKSMTYKVYCVLKKLFTLEWKFKHSDKLFTFLYKKLGILMCNKYIVLSLLLASIVGLGEFVSLFINGSITLFPDSELFGVSLIMFWLINTLVTVSHELSHGVTCKHFGCEVKHAGIQMYYGFPVAFVDTTDIWMASTRARILTSLAGPINDIIWAGLASLLLLFVQDPFLQMLIFQFAFINFVSAFFNLNPLWEMDGYYILMDIIGVPALRKKSFSFIKREGKRLFIRLPKWNHLEWWFFSYGLLSVLWLFVVARLLYVFWREQIVWIIEAMQKGSVELWSILVVLMAIVIILPLSLKSFQTLKTHKKANKS